MDSPTELDDYGRRLMPTILRHEAKYNPQRTFAMVAKSDNLEDGFLDVTFQQVAQAVDYASHWLQNRFENGDKPPRHTTLAYIGVPDLRYNILFYAGVQCRYKVRLSYILRYYKTLISDDRCFCLLLGTLPLSTCHCLNRHNVRG